MLRVSQALLRHLCLFVAVCVIVNAESLVINSDLDCGRNFTMSDDKPVNIIYNKTGYIDECATEFLTHSSDIVCVQILSLDIGCGSMIEFHKHFVSPYTNEGTVTCDMNREKGSMKNKTCFEYVNEFYIFIRRGQNGDTAEFRVTVKRKQYNTERTPVGKAILYAALGIIPAMITLAIIIGRCIIKRRNHRRMNPPYRPATGVTNTTVTVYTDGAKQKPYIPGVTDSQSTALSASSYQPPAVPGNNIPLSTAGYNVHPTVADPVCPPHDVPIHQTAGETQTVNTYPAPQQDKPSPPTYDSVIST